MNTMTAPTPIVSTAGQDTTMCTKDPRVGDTIKAIINGEERQVEVTQVTARWIATDNWRRWWNHWLDYPQGQSMNRETDHLIL